MNKRQQKLFKDVDVINSKALKKVLDYIDENNIAYNLDYITEIYYICNKSEYFNIKRYAERVGYPMERFNDKEQYMSYRGMYSIKDSLNEDFFGAKEGTEEADDILFALQVQYGNPKLTYDECRKEFTEEEVKRAVAYVKRDKLNKFTYFNDSLDKRQRSILAKSALNCYSDKELLDIIYELIDWDNKLFDKAMDIYEEDGSVQYRAKKISDLLIY